MKTSTVAFCFAAALAVAAGIAWWATRRGGSAAPGTPAATALTVLSRAAGFALAFAVTSWAIGE